MDTIILYNYNKKRICEGERCAHLVYSVRSAPLLTCRNGLFWQHLMRGRRELSGRSKAGGADLVICTLDPCRSEPPIPRLSTPSSGAMPSKGIMNAFEHNERKTNSKSMREYSFVQCTLARLYFWDQSTPMRQVSVHKNSRNYFTWNRVLISLLERTIFSI